jgi:hypothetical protein
MGFAGRPRRRTRITAIPDGVAVGYVEVDTNLDIPPRHSRVGAWARCGQPVGWNRPIAVDTSAAGSSVRRPIGRNSVGAARLLDYADARDETRIDRGFVG